MLIKREFFLEEYRQEPILKGKPPLSLCNAGEIGVVFFQSAHVNILLV
jgi:hypothetical protein